MVRTTTMRAWRINTLGAPLAFETIPRPEVRPGTVLVRVIAVPLLSYLRDYVAGTLRYWYPDTPFTPGTNGIGVVEAVGDGVHHHTPGSLVLMSPHLVANEITAAPAQILIGLTGISPDSGPMLSQWRNGTLAEYALLPASCVIPAHAMTGIVPERLATLAKFVVPLGGLLRSRLQAGQTIVVNGATGYFGSAAVLLSLALGAAKVIAFGRNREVLAQIKQLDGSRVEFVTHTGDVNADAANIREAAGGGVHVAFDMVGRADEPSATLAALKSLRRGGRLVLMGSMTSPLPITYSDLMLQDLEIVGQFMYDTDTYTTLLSLVRGGLLNLESVNLRTFTATQLPDAMDAAASMRGLDCTVVRFDTL